MGQVSFYPQNLCFVYCFLLPKDLRMTVASAIKFCEFMFMNSGGIGKEVTKERGHFISSAPVKWDYGEKFMYVYEYVMWSFMVPSSGAVGFYCRLPPQSWRCTRSTGHLCMLSWLSSILVLMRQIQPPHLCILFCGSINTNK